jgi:putative hydrolase of the HAD superfamily
MPSSVSTLLLDAGGTLVMPNFRRIANEFAADGVVVDLPTLERAEIETRRAYDRPDFALRGSDLWLCYMTDLSRSAGLARLPTDAFERLRRYHDTTNLWEELIDGVVPALERLRAHFRLGIISNANGTVRTAFERIGLARFFETIVDSGEEGIEKPDPRIFRVALERMGESAERSAYVGDIYRVDVLGARAAGLRAVLLDPHGVHVQKPCERVASLAELTSLLTGPV